VVRLSLSLSSSSPESLKAEDEGSKALGDRLVGSVADGFAGGDVSHVPHMCVGQVRTAAS
jgi:hypothetical protein